MFLRLLLYKKAFYYSGFINFNFEARFEQQNNKRTDNRKFLAQHIQVGFAKSNNNSKKVTFFRNEDEKDLMKLWKKCI